MAIVSRFPRHLVAHQPLADFIDHVMILQRCGKGMAQIMEAEVRDVRALAQASPRFLKGSVFPPGEESGTELWRSGREGSRGHRVQWNLFWRPLEHRECMGHVQISASGEIQWGIVRGSMWAWPYSFVWVAFL